MSHAAVLAEVKQHVDYAIEQGYSAMYTDEAIEKTILDALEKHGNDAHEEIQMVLMGMLTVFELRRRQTRPQSGAH